ncbi:MAG: gamma-glutamylcyclotransferase [Yoonia sp.]|uniref:gamma-glutamylcyclotransferase n=1 Tax=Yoonia sp. TaxID=2212373 RepID=UPI003EFAB1CB
MDLFVYGTLRSQRLMAAVAGEGPLTCTAATLFDYAVFPVAGNVVPFIASAKGQQAQGLIWRDLTDAQMRRLDAYEGAFGYGFGPVTVQTANGSATAQAYLPPVDMAPGTGEWSLAHWEADHLAPAILAAKDLFSHDPLPDHATLRRMWPMIESRAWSKYRATAAPATVRFAPQQSDITVADAAPPAGRFFRFQTTRLTHQRFDGGQAQDLPREGFVGVDAAIVLPYDPKRDKVVLVEQVRLGPALRHDPNPWMLEPVAGIVDARETPAQAALREVKEEAWLDLTRLLPAGSFYVSPGASTDYFNTYVGLCDLPQDAPYLGGLDHEHEDLRLHPMGFDEALALADSGEIQTGPALYLLYWLLRHRAALRADPDAVI